jgi:outer membrane protein
MNGLIRKFLPGLLLLSVMSSPTLAQNRLATIDLRKVFDNYWKTKQADAALKDRAADMEKEHKNMLDDWKKAKEDYQTLLNSANDQAVSLGERDKRKKAAEDKLKSIKETEETIGQFEKQARTTLDEQRRRMRDNILVEIRGVLNARAKAAGYGLVVDTAAESINNTPIVLFSNNDNDVTDDILKQLNAAAPPDAPKTEEKKEQKSGETKKDEKKK